MKKITVLVIALIVSVISVMPARALASTGTLDQSNGPSINSYSQIDSYEPCGQVFVPNMPTLLGVELFLVSSVTAKINTTITISIHPGLIIENPLVTQSFMIPSDSPSSGAWVYFEFTDPVTVNPENPYVLEVSSDTSYHMWNYIGNTYPEGDMIREGDPNTSADWSFRTWGTEETKSVPAATDVDIDIKPGGNPNSINLKSKGVVPVAVLTTEDFDSTTIDPDTVEFAGAEPVKWSVKDVDSDGDVDIVFHFKTQELNLDLNSTEATLTGKTLDTAINISGTESINIVK